MSLDISPEIQYVLQERFALSDELFGALVVFTLVNTLLPGFLLRTPPPEFDTPEVPPAPARLMARPVAPNSVGG